jgi:ribosome recycling factor
MDSALKKELLDKMDKALAILDKDLKGLRTGRASVNLLDPVVVEAYGNRMPIAQVGTVSTPDAKTISIQVWDKSMVKAVEKAIAEANLGLSPSSDGQLIRINLPVISEERRKELVKVASSYAENSKVALRNIRREGMDHLKQLEKSGDLSKDEHHQYSEEVEELTKEYIAKVDKIAQERQKDILTI